MSHYSTWTFGIVTDGKNPERLHEVIHSIHAEADTLRDDIIIVGGKINPAANIIWIPFDESIKEGWITKKKNLIAQFARTEYICMMHDYVALSPGWRAGYEQFTQERGSWLSCTNQILNMNGTNFRSSAVIFNDGWPNEPIDNLKMPDKYGPGRLLNPHYIDSWARFFYYSGAYFCANRNLLLAFPFDENRVHGGGEDVWWSRQIYKQYGANVFNFNKYSHVRFLKQKDNAPWELRPEINFGYNS